MKRYKDIIKTRAFTGRAWHKKTFWVALILLTPLGVYLAVPSGGPAQSSPGIKSDELSVMGRGGAPSKITLAPQEREKVYTSPAYKTAYEFNAVAPHWKESDAPEGSRTVEIRTSENGRDWSGWLEIEAAGPLRENDPHPDRIFTENPVFISGKHFQYKVSLERSDSSVAAPIISDLKVTYMDSRSNTGQASLGQKLARLKSRVTPQAFAADQGSSIISRAAWGSPDPQGTMFKGTALEWPLVGSPVNQVFIHHTVNSNYQKDPAAVVRGIWEFHAKTRGWGDIGYNFLIDHNGTIYEGRAGGDNIVGGHVLSYNTGSLGVAVIGCFDKNSATCNELNGGTTSAPSNSVLHGLTELLAWKTTNFEIDPKATHTFCGSSCLNLHTIASHKDANQTSCPGDLLYNNLGFIRDETARKKALYAYAYSAKQSSYATADLVSSSSTAVTLSFKNTGTATWSNTTNRVLLRLANPMARASSFQGTGWIDADTPALLNETSVAPGATGTFTFKLQRPDNFYGNSYEYFRLVSEGIGEVRAFYTVPISGPVYSSAYARQGAYPVLVKDGSQKQISLSYKNTGNQPWYDDTSLASAPAGTKPVHLATSHPMNRPSTFGAAWNPDKNRPAVNFTAVFENDGTTLAADQHITQPGQIAKYTVRVSAPSTLMAGTYREFFQPIVENGTAMNDPWTFTEIKVEDVRYASSYKSQSEYPELLPGGASKTVRLEYHNTGNQPWYDDTSLGTAPAGTKPVHLATSYPLNRPSSFGTAWNEHRNRPGLNFAAVYRQDGSLHETNPHIVQPGEAVRFEFTVSSPFNLSAGTYKEYFQPIVEGGSIMNDSGTHLGMKVIASVYTSLYADQCTYPTLIRGGPASTCYISYKNTGNQPWYDDASLGTVPVGTKPVHLATSRHINRTSHFGLGWNTDRNRPAVNFAAIYESDGVTLAANQHIAQPGQIAKFSFSLSAPAALPVGTYIEFFQPIVESGTAMNDPWTSLVITVE